MRPSPEEENEISWVQGGPLKSYIPSTSHVSRNNTGDERKSGVGRREPNPREFAGFATIPARLA